MVRELLRVLPGTRLLLSFFHLLADKSLIIKILELLVNQTKLVVGETKGFTIGEVLEGSELVKQNKVVVADIEVDTI